MKKYPIKFGRKEGHIMTLTERFETLTPDQREKFNALKDGAGLDAFLTETGWN